MSRIPSYTTDEELIEIRDKSKAAIDALRPILELQRVASLLSCSIFDSLMRQTTDRLDQLLNFALEANDAALQEMAKRGLTNE